MAQTLPTDAQLAKIWGLVPRYMREQGVAEGVAAGQPVAVPVAPAVPEFDPPAARLDAGTAALRRRIAASRLPRLSPVAMAAPALAGASLLLGMLLGH